MAVEQMSSSSAAGSPGGPASGLPSVSPVSPRRALVALIALSVSAFCFVTTEVLPVGLLTVIAPDLGRSEAQIGLLVTGYAVVVVLASLPLTRLTHRIPRRHVLTGTLAVFVVGTALSAATSDYYVLLGARLLTGLTQAMFWAVVASTATGLFPPQVRGRMVARLSIGAALAPVLGIPLATWLGQQAGWRTAFLAVAAVNLITCVAVGALVPTVAPKDGGAARGSEPSRRRYTLVAVATVFGVTGALGTYTYITPFLLDVSGFAAAVLGLLLLVDGLFGVVGTVLVGRFLDRRPWESFAAPLVVLTAALLLMYAFGAVKIAAIALLAMIGLAFSAFAASVQNLALRVAPGSTDMASAGTSSAFNVGIAAGSLIGAGLIASVSVRVVPLFGAAMTAVAVVIVFVGLSADGVRLLPTRHAAKPDPCPDIAPPPDHAPLRTMTTFGGPLPPTARAGTC